MEFNDRRQGTVHDPSYGTHDRATRSEYTKAYQSGWRHSGGSRADLDNNPHHADPLKSTAWEDGYMDRAVGQEKFAWRAHRYGEGTPRQSY